MRPIKISKEILLFFEDLVTMELANPNSVLSRSKANIIALKNRYSSIEPEYLMLKSITLDFKKWILLTPSEQSSIVSLWAHRSSNIFYNPLRPGRRKTTDFCEEILAKLNYNGFRRQYAKKYIEVTGIKACPYCNAMLTIVADNEDGTLTSRFQLDHFYPKTKFPLLSISIFNLIPCCGNCNQFKSSGDVILGQNFHLFADETPLNGFRFRIPKHSFVRYWLTMDIRDLKIKFVRGRDSSKSYRDDHNNTYRIEGIYETQIDIAEEILLKSKYYNDSRIKELANLLKLHPSVIRRLIVGNYVDVDDIHKRPLAKFMQDIAKQAKLIK